MRKVVLLMVLSLTLLQACASYKPIIDSKGRSGTFNETRAEEITDDKQHCEYVAKSNTSKLKNLNTWLSSPTLDTHYSNLYRKCLQGRGHSVLN